MQRDRLGIIIVQIIKLQIGQNYHDQVIAILFPTSFPYVYVICEDRKVLLKQNKLVLVPKRVGNPQLCIPTHSEALAYISFQRLLLLFKNPLLFFHQILSEAEHSCPFPERELGNVKFILVFPTQKILSAKEDQISQR